MAISKIISSSISDNTVVAADVGPNAITASELADDAVDTAAIANDAVTGAKIENNPTIAGNLTVGGTSTLTGAVTLSSDFVPATPLSHRNLIINGAMQINQRGWTSSAVTDAYTIDRWKVTEQTDGAITAEQSTDTPDGFANSLKITVTSADTSLGSTQYARVNQQIEGTNMVGLAFGTTSAKTITISFQVKSSLTGTFSGCIRAIGVNRSYPFTYAISSANTWESKSVTITGDTGGSWDYSTSGGMSLYLTLCSGPGYDAPAGAWETSGASAAEGGVNVLGTNGATWQITGVQLELGSVATPFEHRSYADVLRSCERYYEAIGNFVGLSNNTPTSIDGVCSFRTTKRTSSYTIGRKGNANISIAHPTISGHSATSITSSHKYKNYFYGGLGVSNTGHGRQLVTIYLADDTIYVDDEL